MKYHSKIAQRGCPGIYSGVVWLGLYSTPFFLIFLVAIIFQNVYMMPAMGWVVDFGIELFIAIWIAVTPAYAYIKYAREE